MSGVALDCSASAARSSLHRSSPIPQNQESRSHDQVTIFHVPSFSLLSLSAVCLSFLSVFTLRSAVGDIICVAQKAVQFFIFLEKF
jgi:hypothetical protein